MMALDCDTMASKVDAYPVRTLLLLFSVVDTLQAARLWSRRYAVQYYDVYSWASDHPHVDMRAKRTGKVFRNQFLNYRPRGVYTCGGVMHFILKYMRLHYPRRMTKTMVVLLFLPHSFYKKILFFPRCHRIWTTQKYINIRTMMKRASIFRIFLKKML